MGQAGRQLRRLYRGRGRPRQRLSRFLGIADPPRLRRYRLQGRQRRTASQRRRAPTTSSARRPPRRRNCCNKAGATSIRRRKTRAIRSATSTPPPTSTSSPTWTLQGVGPFSLVLSDDRRRQFDQRSALRRSRRFSASTTCVTPANGLNGQQLANPFPAERDARRDRSHADADDQRRGDVAGDQHGQIVRPRQSFRRSAAVSTMASPILAPARNSASFSPITSSAGSGFSSALRQSGFRRAGLAAHDQRLHRPLCARHFRRDEGFLDFRRRPAERRQYPVAGSARRRRSTATTPLRTSIR